MTNQITSSSEDHQNQGCEHENLSIGSFLRRQRERQDMTIANIADHLKVPQAYVEDIESDTYERLPEMTFIQGYVKNYARLLQLDESEIKEKFQTSVSERNFHIKGMPKRKKNISLSVLFSSICIVILAAIGGLTGIWLYHNHQAVKVQSAKAPHSQPPHATLPSADKAMNPPLPSGSKSLSYTGEPDALKTTSKNKAG